MFIYVCMCVWSGGYNLQDVVFYWTRGNDSVKGLDTLRLAQYSVESYYTSVSEAVYETGAMFLTPLIYDLINKIFYCTSSKFFSF